jgi:hypothetical protein
VTVTFETECKILTLANSTFYCCLSLESICIPASVEAILEDCFSWCSVFRASHLSVIVGCASSMTGHLWGVRCSNPSAFLRCFGM